MALHLIEKDVREYIQDRSIMDNDGLDLAFTTEDIVGAMRRAAMAFNALAPVFIRVRSGNDLPCEMFFLDAIVEQLYQGERAKLTRQDIDYSAGNVEAPILRKRIEYLQKLIEEHKGRWEQAARDWKITANFRAAYGRIG